MSQPNKSKIIITTVSNGHTLTSDDMELIRTIRQQAPNVKIEAFRTPFMGKIPLIGWIQGKPLDLPTKAEQRLKKSFKKPSPELEFTVS
jgi:hypothetical protein